MTILVAQLLQYDRISTRLDTRPPVADRWAGAEMRVFTRKNAHEMEADKIDKIVEVVKIRQNERKKKSYLIFARLKISDEFDNDLLGGPNDTDDVGKDNDNDLVGGSDDTDDEDA